MSDIIKDAKQILGGATPGKWRAADSDIIAEDSNRFIATVSEYSGLDELSEEYANVQLIAAAPELAQALAEETYEYAVQVKIGAKWLFLGRGTGGRNFARNAFWFVKKENAQDYMAIRKDMSAPTRIVRQRRSPVEVINE